MVFMGLLDKEYLSLCTTFFKALRETTMQYNWTQARAIPQIFRYLRAFRISNWEHIFR